MKSIIKSRRVFVSFILVFVIFTAILASKWDAIFQRGNPLPYLAAMVKLNSAHTFEPVRNMDGIYITKRGNHQDLFQMIEATYNMEFKDQLGSGYLFSDGVQVYIVASEIYWGKFTVWTLPSA